MPVGKYPRTEKHRKNLSISHMGKKPNENQLRGLSIGWNRKNRKNKPNQGFQKGNKIGSSNKGIKRSQEFRDKIRRWRLGKHQEGVGLWKGDKVSYTALHMWVSRWKGKPMKCEMCGAEGRKRYDWANIDHKYRRVLEDYIRLCVPCHAKYDYENNNKKKKPKGKIKGK